MGWYPRTTLVPPPKSLVIEYRIGAMPIFEYLCRDCREKFEKLVLGRGDRAPVACPRCGRTATEQVFSTFAVVGAVSGPGSDAAAAACGPSSCGRFT